MNYFLASSIQILKFDCGEIDLIKLYSRSKISRRFSCAVRAHGQEQFSERVLTPHGSNPVLVPLHSTLSVVYKYIVLVCLRHTVPGGKHASTHNKPKFVV